MIGLILLLVMSVFGAFALKGSILQERMAGNQRDYKIAFESSEIALRWGEAWLNSRTPITRPFPCQTVTKDVGKENCNALRRVIDANLLSHNLLEQDPWHGTNDWLPDNARSYGTDPETGLATNPAQALPGLASQPVFLMEQAFVDRDDLAGNPQQGRIYYRIHAAGKGARNSTLAYGESSMTKRFE